MRCGRKRTDGVSRDAVFSARNDGLVFVERIAADVCDVVVSARGYREVTQPYDGCSPRLTIRLQRYQD